jgi:two-component sensor histidine kinase
LEPGDSFVLACLDHTADDDGAVAMAAHRWQVDGPPVVVSPPTALSLALVLHELATVAVKYGALAMEEGALTIRCRIDTAADSMRRLSLEWREPTSTPFSAPRHTGFGTRLLQSLSRQDGNRVDHEARPDGVVCRLAVSVEEVRA